MRGQEHCWHEKRSIACEDLRHGFQELFREVMRDGDFRLGNG